MKAMVLHSQRQPLRATELPSPSPGPGEVLVRVRACAVCRTDLHVVDGELPQPKLPLVPGHEIVGVVAAKGEGVERFKIGDRVGVPWLGWTCGVCDYCRTGRENLCDQARFTGYTLRWRVCRIHRRRPAILLSHPGSYSDAEAAPLLCAGLIGYRSLGQDRRGQANRDLRLRRRGAHHHASGALSGTGDLRIYAPGRPGRAGSLPDHWAPCGLGIPRPCRPRNWTRPSFSRPQANWSRWRSRRCAKGGTVVCGGIHMSDDPGIPLRASVGGAQHLFSGQPHAPGWGGVLCAGAPRPGAHHCANVSAD